MPWNVLFYPKLIFLSFGKKASIFLLSAGPRLSFPTANLTSVTEIWLCWSILCTHPHHQLVTTTTTVSSLGKSTRTSTPPVVLSLVYLCSAGGLSKPEVCILASNELSSIKFSNNLLNLFWPSQFPVAMGSAAYSCEGGKSFFFSVLNLFLVSLIHVSSKWADCSLFTISFAIYPFGILRAPLGPVGPLQNFP